MLIIGWGGLKESLKAGLYFIVYTLFASLPLLITLLFIEWRLGRLTIIFGGWDILYKIAIRDYIVSVGLVLAFLVKMPIFIFHQWLPKAHVEAPVAGSIILAGVLLKLGGYGLSRVIKVFIIGILKIGYFLIGLSLLRIVFVGFICSRLRDIKALVAYSSVAHIGVVLSGLISGYYWGLIGGLAIILSHGLSSSGLFCLVNVYYERTRSRRLYFNKGIILLFPSICIIIFLICGANISSPPTINLLSEIFLLVSIFSYNWLILISFPLGSFLGAVFTLYLYSISQHGKLYKTYSRFLMIYYIEFHVLVLHLLPLNIIFLNSFLFVWWL